jgi:hypothetical protein
VNCGFVEPMTESNPRIQLGKLTLHERIVGTAEVVAAAVLQRGQRAWVLRERLCQNSAGNSAVSPPELSATPSRRSFSGIPVGDTQGWNPTLVDLVQSGIALLLLGLDLGDVGFEIAAGFLDDVTVARIPAEPQVGPPERKIAVSHLRSPTIHGRPDHPPALIRRRRVPGAHDLGAMAPTALD